MELSWPGLGYGRGVSKHKDNYERKDVIPIGWTLVASATLRRAARAATVKDCSFIFGNNRD